MSADEPTKEGASTAHEGPRGTPGREKGGSVRPGGPASLIGMTLSGRYRIERLLGEGGMGAVYQAEHTHMRKRLAVKVLHPEMSRLPEVVARFEREAMAAAHIDHPNVATATDFGKLEDGSFFLVLEFVEGKSLRDAINDGRLELGRALHITRQIAAALKGAHALGIVHRDLKPENVMLVERDGDADFVKVLDFGIAKVPVGELAQSSGEKGPVLTQLGMVYGTPEYMAPEQALGQNVDARADLYGVGVMAFEMLTASRPYDHDSKVALLGMHVTAAIPLPSERRPDAGIPAEVDAIVKTLLAKEASERFQDAKELIDTINATLASLAAQGRVAARFAGVAPASSPLVTSAALPTRATLASGAALGSISAEHPDAPPPSEKHDPSSRTVVAIGASLAGVLALVMVVIIILTRGGSPGTTTLADGATVATSSSSAPKPTSPTRSAQKPEVETQIRDAIALVDKGDYATAISQLTDLQRTNASRTDIHRALVDAYMATKQPSLAMEEAAKTLAVDGGFAKDKQLRLHVRNAALTGGKEAEEKAFGLLEGSLGSDGPDGLYDIAYIVKDYPKPQARARSSLKRTDVRAKATDELKLALDVRYASQTSPCELRKYFDKAAEIGDWRTSTILKGYLSTGGCGFLGKRDCWPCLHGDGSLGRALQRIDERSKEKKE